MARAVNIKKCLNGLHILFGFENFSFSYFVVGKTYLSKNGEKHLLHLDVLCIWRKNYKINASKEKYLLYYLARKLCLLVNTNIILLLEYSAGKICYVLNELWLDFLFLDTSYLPNISKEILSNLAKSTCCRKQILSKFLFYFWNDKSKLPAWINRNHLITNIKRDITLKILTCI